MLRAIRRYLSLEADDARAMLERAFRNYLPHQRGPGFAVRLWDGQTVAWGDGPEFTLVFADAETLRQCLASRDPACFAEAYVDGRLQIEGDLWAASSLATTLRGLQLRPLDRLRFAPRLVVPSSSHTTERDRQDVQAHYDRSDELFRSFLDENMVYSCAYFSDPEQSLERAQERKLELVCRKLHLRPGDRLLDVGCGWGALLLWAAKHHGVRAHGITLSENQAAQARRRAHEAGLGDRVTVELRHYADLPAERFDKVSSIGMVEHVGVAKLPAYLEAVHRVLRPGGLFLNHGISMPPGGSDGTGGAFIFRHVFPGAELAPVSLVQARMEAVGLEILDVQALRPHYALTLREWFRRFRARRDRIAQHVPERVLRVWDLYLSGCARAFEDGVIGVHQVLVGKPDAHGRTAAGLTRAAMQLD